MPNIIRSMGCIIILLIMAVFSAKGQKEPAKGPTEPCNDSQKPIGEIDMISKTHDLCNACKPKGCYRIKVVNMNPLLYTLDYTTTDVITQIGSTDNLLDKLIGNFDKPPKETTEGKDAARVIISPKNKCEEFELKVDEFNSKIQGYKTAKDKIREFLAFCQSVKNICLNPALTQTQILAAITSVSGHISLYRNNNGIREMTPSDIAVHASQVIAGYKAAFENLKKTFTDVAKGYEKCKDFAADTNNHINFVNMLDLFEETESVYKSIAEVFEKFKESEVAGVGTEVGNYYIIVSTPYSFTRCITIACGDIDSSKTVVNFYKATDTSKNRTSVFSAKLDLRIKGGMRNFRSPGLMLNFGGVRDEKYFLDKDSIVRKESTKNKAFLSLAYMENFYWRSCNDFAGGFSFGLAANLNNITELTSLRFFLGPTLFIGEKSRFMISGGLTGGFSERLKGKFEADKKIDPDLFERDGSSLTDKYFTFGIYFGVSYKLF